MAERKKFEYKNLDIALSIDMLNKYGEMCWELCVVIKDIHGTPHSFFKREKVEDDDK